MSILREYTSEKHKAAESTPFIQYMLNGNITKEHYAWFLQQMNIVYGEIEYFGELHNMFHDLPDIKRANYIYDDLIELGYNKILAQNSLISTQKYKEHIMTLHYKQEHEKILAHVYVRHMGDLYGGKIIAKRVPGSGKAYQFADRPALIKALDAKLSMDILDEALLAFDFSTAIFDELMEKINE